MQRARQYVLQCHQCPQEFPEDFSKQRFNPNPRQEHFNDYQTVACCLVSMKLVPYLMKSMEIFFMVLPSALMKTSSKSFSTF